MKLGETLQKRSHDLAVLQRHLSTTEENIQHQFRAQLGEMSVILADKDQLNCQIAEECQQQRLQIETLTAKAQYIKKLETKTQKVEEARVTLTTMVSKL